VPIDIKKKGAVNVFEISGRLTLGQPTTELQEKFKGILEAGNKSFVFDLTKVPFIDSTSLGEMVACAKRARERGGDIKLVLLPKGKVWEVMTMTFLHKSFDIHDTLDDAMAAYTK
jgi:anti-anti-sigma factor